MIDEFVEGLDNGAGAPGRLMRISGVRGTGKTVLLEEVARIASARGWVALKEVAARGFCQRILEELVPRTKISHIKIEPTVAGISAGSLGIDHIGPTLKAAMEEVIDRNGNGLLITLDEVQDAVLDEVRALAVAIQQVIGDDYDIAFVFAGLPSMVENVINGKTLTFLRRTLPFDLKAVGIGEVLYSFEEAVEASGMEVDAAVADELAAATYGYPFMIQLVGYYAWQCTKRSHKTVVDEGEARRGIAMARERFDAMAIEPALQRVPESGVTYLLAMASLGEVCSSGEVAERVGKTPQQLSSTRSRLLRDSIIEAPAYGKVSFAIPYMGDYLNEHCLELEAELGD